jgi:hypothetical protein
MVPGKDEGGFVMQSSSLGLILGILAIVAITIVVILLI